MIISKIGRRVLVGAALRADRTRPYETDALERRPYQHHLVGAALRADRTRPYAADALERRPYQRISW